MLSVVTKTGIHALSARIPEPLFDAASGVSSITGQSMNQLITEGLELVVANFNSIASANSITVNVPDVSTVRASYSNDTRWSQPYRTSGLTKWYSTAEETEDGND